MSIRRCVPAAVKRMSSSSLGRTIKVRSPRDGQVFEEIADMTASEVDAAAELAHSCSRTSWAHPSSVNVRCESLRSLASAIRRDREPLARLESLDCGKPIVESREDMNVCADLCDFYAEVAPAEFAEVPIGLPDRDFKSRTVPAPAGVVACVTPWNYPLMQAICKVAPAIAAGCTTLLKPSPLASLSCLELHKLGTEAGLPVGALAVLTGGPPDGEGDGAARLLAHPAVDFLSFTGSTRGGREMLYASAAHVRRTGLELGGKGAMIVLADADLAAVVDWAMLGIFFNAGQICSATSRLLVHADAADALLARLDKAARGLRVGDPLDETTQVGAVISARAASSIRERVHEACVRDGAQLLCGGAGQGARLPPELAGGYYVAPTILVDPPLTSAAWRDEIFGPVLCVRTFHTDDEAVALANDTPYGLAHAVMSADEGRAEFIASRLDAGTVWINASQPLWPQTPFGGWKASGFGKEWGVAGLHEYLRYKTVTSAAVPGFSWNYFGS